MGAYKYVQELFRKKQSDVMRFVLRIRVWQYRQMTKMHRAPRSTRPDKARRLGYRNKEGNIITQLYYITQCKTVIQAPNPPPLKILERAHVSVGLCICTKFSSFGSVLITSSKPRNCVAGNPQMTDSADNPCLKYGSLYKFKYFLKICNILNWTKISQQPCFFQIFVCL